MDHLRLRMFYPLRPIESESVTERLARDFYGSADPTFLSKELTT